MQSWRGALLILSLSFALIYSETSRAQTKPSLDEIDRTFHATILKHSKPSTDSLIQHAFLTMGLPIKTPIIHANANNSLQALIDQAALDLMQTPTGKTLCSYPLVDSSAIRRYLAVSPQVADEISKICDQATVGQKRAESIRLDRSFIFVTKTPQAFGFDSWTNQLNQSFIFLRGNETKADIYRRIYHEIAMGVDGLLLLHSDNAADLLNGVATIHAESTQDKNTLRKVLRALASPLPKGTFSSIRAFAFEAWAFQDLQEVYAFEVPPLYQELSGLHDKEGCLRVFDLISSLLEPLQNYFLPSEYMITHTPEMRKEDGAVFFFSTEQKNIYLQLLRENSIEVKTARGRSSLCSFLSLPTFGDAGFHFNRGPRPRGSGADTRGKR